MTPSPKLSTERLRDDAIEVASRRTREQTFDALTIVEHKILVFDIVAAYLDALREAETPAEAGAELNELLRKAKAAYDAMTPEQRAAHDQAQRESFGRGMGPCEHGVLDFEDCPDCRAATPSPTMPEGCDGVGNSNDGREDSRP